jgi:putative transposase
MTLWEHRKAVQILKNRGRAKVNEELIFRINSEMQELKQNAAKESKSARRDKARREHLSTPPPGFHGEPQQKEAVTQEQSTAQCQSAKPFDDIEQW